MCKDEAAKPHRRDTVFARSAKTCQKLSHPRPNTPDAAVVQINICQSDYEARILCPRLSRSDEPFQFRFGGFSIAGPQRRMNAHAQNCGIVGIEPCSLGPETGVMFVPFSKLRYRAPEKECAPPVNAFERLCSERSQAGTDCPKRQSSHGPKRCNPQVSQSPVRC